MRFAILEDDNDQAMMLAAWLEEAGHTSASYSSGPSLLRSFSHDSYDVLLLDWMLPEMTGLQVLEYIRENIDAKVPILFITQKDEESAVVKALEAGADDYMSKPVTQQELLARIGALARRAGIIESAADEELVIEPYRFVLKSRQLEMDGELVNLTRKEYELALFLFKNIGRVISRGHILEAVWGTRPSLKTRTVDTHVSNLRHKLSLGSSGKWKLTSIYQHGYRIEPAE